MAFDRKFLDEMQRRLQERRTALVRSAQGAQRELEALKGQERMPELEEGAQAASAEFVLTQLSDSTRREVQQIDAAIARVEAGSYGRCVDCGGEISRERLRALPYALRDAECSERLEQREFPDREFPQM
jgi:DnaK suppressor protein